MNNHHQKEGRLLTNGHAQAFTVATFTALVFVAGCRCGGDLSVSMEADAKILKAADQQLAAAQDRKTWNDEEQQTFDLKVSQLPLNEHFELSRRLAVLLDSPEVKVYRRKVDPDPEACPYVPDLCLTTAPGTPAPPDRPIKGK